MRIVAGGPFPWGMNTLFFNPKVSPRANAHCDYLLTMWQVNKDMSDA